MLLDTASFDNSAKFVQHLLKLNADPTLIASQGYTPLMLAKKEEMDPTDTIQLLEKVSGDYYPKNH